jgi:anaerobic ribonucleoside-triphosphate reductase
MCKNIDVTNQKSFFACRYSCQKCGSNNFQKESRILPTFKDVSNLRKVAKILLKQPQTGFRKKGGGKSLKI